MCAWICECVSAYRKLRTRALKFFPVFVERNYTIVQMGCWHRITITIIAIINNKIDLKLKKLTQFHYPIEIMFQVLEGCLFFELRPVQMCT